MQQELHRIVREATAEGRTVFLSSHVLSEVERMADRVEIIRHGRLVDLQSRHAQDPRPAPLRARLRPAGAGRGLRAAAGVVEVVTPVAAGDWSPAA